MRLTVILSFKWRPARSTATASSDRFVRTTGEQDKVAVSVELDGELTVACGPTAAIGNSKSRACSGSRTSQLNGVSIFDARQSRSRPSGVVYAPGASASQDRELTHADTNRTVHQT